METTEKPYWFDPSDIRCQSPYGAAPSHSTVRLSLRPFRSDCYRGGVLTTRWEFDNDRVVRQPVLWTGWDGDRDIFSVELELDDYVGLIWYTLRLEKFDGTVEETEEYQLTVYDSAESVPTWFGEGVSYQIFPDRFHRLSVPDPTGMVGGRWVHSNWEEDPAYRPDERGEIRNRDFFGGSIPGIIEKLPYLQSLGVETLYLCPIFEAPENHRYGVADYEKIDPMLGSREDFTRLCEKAHALGMKVMLDGVFNHTAFSSKYFNGDGFYPEPGAFQSKDSPYYDWFWFQNWPHQYTSWWGFYSMPTTNKNSAAWLDYITGENGIIRSWLRAGADGWRLDVADELPDSVVHAIHSAARAEKPSAVIIGEVWEDASNKIAYSVRRHHILGGHCDGVMNYPVRNAIIGYLLGANGDWFQQVIETQRRNYPRWAFYSGMNSLGTHDTVRILTLLGEESDRKNDTSRDWRAGHFLSPDRRSLAVARLKVGSLLLYALPGSPTVYYGDEVGMQGFEDPFNRRTFPWGHEDYDLLGWFTALGKARKELLPLRKGEFSWLSCGGKLASFCRSWEGETVAALANTGDTSLTAELPDETSVVLPPLTARLLRQRDGDWEPLI